MQPDSLLDLAAVPVARLHLIENTWIVSTYLRLRGRGCDVRITDRLVPDHINVCTSERLLRYPGAERAFIVVVDADRRDLLWGDFHLVQSPAMLRARDCVLLDHWPQPGLRPRDPARGARLERIAYFGYPGNLARAFREPSFTADLRRLGVEFVLREQPEQWHDYHDVDLCLAVRDLRPYLLATKPATKLAQAWLTGCPALLGQEPAYRYWGVPGVDYFEVATADEAIDTVHQLKAQPELYRAVIAAGRAKAPAHDEEAVARQWIAVLDGPVRAAFERWQAQGAAGALRRRLWFAATRVIEPSHRRVFRLRAEGLGVFRRALGRPAPRPSAAPKLDNAPTSAKA